MDGATDPYTVFRCPTIITLAVVLSCSGALQVVGQQSVEDSATVPGDVPTKFTRHIAFNDARNWRTQLAGLDAKAFSAVEQVEVYWHADRALMELIASFPRLESLYIHELPSDIDFENVMAPIAKMRRLKDLEIRMVDAKQRRLAFLGKLKALESFQCDMIVGASDVAFLASLPRLTTLELPSGINMDGIRQRGGTTEAVRGFPRLTTLRVNYAPQLALFKNARKLESLDILSPIGKDDIALVRSFSNLKHLDVAVRSVDCIAPICELPKLEDLHLDLSWLSSRRPLGSDKVTPK